MAGFMVAMGVNAVLVGLAVFLMFFADPDRCGGNRIMLAIWSVFDMNLVYIIHKKLQCWTFCFAFRFLQYKYVLISLPQ